MQAVFFLLVALAATTLGATTGIGGGVLIKPALDLFTGLDVESISLLSSSAVFVMSVITVYKRRNDFTASETKKLSLLSLGAIVGGFFGDSVFSVVTQSIAETSLVFIIQNSILFLLITWVVVFIRYKEKIPTFHIHRLLTIASIGFLLGTTSSFLGIGGGSVNVPIMVIVFSTTTKMASVYSLVVILFSQFAKLGMVALTTGFSEFNLTMLPAMLVGAVLGGMIGSFLHKHLKESTAKLLFSLIQIPVLLMCFLNIVTRL